MACPVLPDDELLVRIRAGDESAFDSLVRGHYNGLCVFAARLMRSDAVAEEVVQDVLLRVWQQREHWTVTASVSAYLFAAVRNTALNHVRRTRFFERWQESAVSEPDVTSISGHIPPTDERQRTNELAEALDRAIEELPPRCRQVFILRRQHHMSCIEVARVMQITPKTVEVQIGNALKQLRRSLAHLL
jgi:RNA polymerase sigma-70 factor (ECF subfamily)